MTLIGFEDQDGNPVYKTPEEKEKFRKEFGGDVQFVDDFMNEIKKEVEDKTIQKKRDINHLRWIYNRMIIAHNEDENRDYMIRFNEVIEKLTKELK